MATTDQYFRNSQTFDPLTDIGSEAPQELSKLISSSPSLKIYTRISPQFHELKSIWNRLYTENEPLALIRPVNSSEVSAIIKYCVANNLPLTVRNGGHDLWGRSNVANAVILDIRELNSIVLAEDQQSVTIGGGVQTGPLVDFLDAHGLVTSCTLAGMVGHFGWASNGGFGPLVGAFGLGLDQITGAKIITYDGEEKWADDELLWGIRGAGGAFGVTTEVKLKTYKLPNFLGGMLVFQIDQAADILEKLQTMYDTENVPSVLTIGLHFSKRMGHVGLMCAFSWASEDLDQGRVWLEKVKAFGTVMMDMVSEISMKKWVDQMAPILPAAAYNHSRSVLLSTVTPRAIEIFTSYAHKIPDGVQWAIATFLVRGEAIKPNPGSCFPMREPYVFLHALAPVADISMENESRAWTEELIKELKEEGLVKENYLAIMGPELSVEDCFGKEGFERLKKLKAKVDPKNVFKHVPASLV